MKFKIENIFAVSLKKGCMYSETEISMIDNGMLISRSHVIIYLKGTKISKDKEYTLSVEFCILVYIVTKKTINIFI